MSFVLAEAQLSPISGASKNKNPNTSVLWFKSSTLKTISPFALQLETRSPEATNGGYPAFWFEIVVFSGKNGTIPVKSYFSHMNEFVSDSSNDVWHFGPIFYPDHSLIQSIEVGHVIGVQIGSLLKSKWSLQVQGRLIAKPILATSLSLTKHLMWSLRDSPDQGVYTIFTEKHCSVKGYDKNPDSAVWFKTPPLSNDIVSRLSCVKLFTAARSQGDITNSSLGIRSWFEIAVYAGEDEDEDEEPLNYDGEPLVAVSHEITANTSSNKMQDGKLFTDEDDVISCLEDGNVIGVRVCAQHGGWENHAERGRLLIGVSEREITPLPPKEEELRDFTLQLLKLVGSYDKEVLKGVFKELEVTGVTDGEPRTEGPGGPKVSIL